MLAKVVGIGNSAGIVIPTALMSALGLKRNDKVSISETTNGFIVKKVPEAPKTFEALLEDYYGAPFGEALARFRSEGDDVELNWGEPRGEELLQ